MKNGSGKWKKSEAVTSNQYEGDYLNDKKHGHGQFNWESGNWYSGNYRHDKRHGLGEMHWADGTVYDGEWEYGA
jgi:hypothetical protein